MVEIVGSKGAYDLGNGIVELFALGDVTVLLGEALLNDRKVGVCVQQLQRVAMF